MSDSNELSGGGLIAHIYQKKYIENCHRCNSNKLYKINFNSYNYQDQYETIAKKKKRRQTGKTCRHSSPMAKKKIALSNNSTNAVSSANASSNFHPPVNAHPSSSSSVVVCKCVDEAEELKPITHEPFSLKS